MIRNTCRTEYMEVSMSMRAFKSACENWTWPILFPVPKSSGTEVQDQQTMHLSTVVLNN